MNKRLNLWMPVLLALLFVVSCSPSSEPQASFDDYLYRLGNSLDVPSNIKSEARPPLRELVRYPSARELTHTLLPANMNLIEFLSLSKCDLQRHIGQRNSSLGRFMAPSQRLLYEYEFIRLAKLCLPQLDNKSRYADLLSVLEQKQQQLPQVKWNAVFSSRELVTLFSLGSKPLSREQLQQKPSELLLALENLFLFVNQAEYKASEIEKAYGVIASSKRLGELRLSMYLTVDHLRKADALLQYRIQEKPLCFKQRPNSQFEIVNTVFLKYYIQQIQAYIALLHQEAALLLNKMDQLAVSLPSVEAFKPFWLQVYQSEDSEWQQFNLAVKQHTETWQALLRQCGRLPQA